MHFSSNTPLICCCVGNKVLPFHSRQRLGSNSCSLDEGSRTVNTCTSFTSQVWPDGARYKGQWVRVAQLILLMSGSLDATNATAGCLWNVFLFCETYKRRCVR